MPDSPINKLSVLVVDDEAICRRALTSMLRHLGAGDLACAANGDQAVELVAQRDFDLILCDLRMPGRDGVETLRLFGAQEVTSAIVLLSGSDPKLLRSAKELGRSQGLLVQGVLNKPIRLAELEEVMKAATSRARPSQKRRTEKADPADLERAILNNELVLHYQPQLELKTRELTGMEALVRWNHPQRGLLYPDAFIGVAESTELIEPLTDWVVRQAIAQSTRWHRAGLPIGVSVNLSAKSLLRLDLPDRMAEAVTRANIPPEKLTLEVTETGVADDVGALMEIATRLRLKGFPLSIDDFGTGFANLTQLQRLPFSELKLDRSFVSAAVHDPDAAAVLKSSVELAQRLALETVAEGIETAQEWKLLSSLGVERGQGFYMGRPMPPEQLPEWRQKWMSGASPPVEPPASQRREAMSAI